MITLVILIKKANHSEKNDDNSMQYVMTAYHSNKSFIYLLIVQDTSQLNKISIAQYFVLDRYAEPIFQGIMPNTGIAKVFTAGKSQFKAL